MYSIVEFEIEGSGDSEIAVAPNVWIKDDYCMWPPFKNNERIQKAVQTSELPQENVNWQFYKILRVMKQFETYSLARRNLSKAAYTSDLSECDTPKRVSKRPCLYSPEHDDRRKRQQTAKAFKPLPSISMKQQPPKLELPIPPRFPPLQLNPSSPQTLPAVGGPARVNISAPSVTSVVEELSDTEFTFQLVNPEDVFSEDGILNDSTVDQEDHRNPGNTVEGIAPITTNGLKPTLSFERFVVEEIISMKSMLVELRGKVDALGSLEGGRDDVPEFEDEDFGTAQTIEEIQAISAKAAEDKEYRKKLIQHLSSLGGTKCTKALTRMLHELMSDKVAVSYSYKGQRDKLSFEALGFTPVLSASLKQNPFTRRERSCFNIEAAIMSWLKRAASRTAKKGQAVRSPLLHSDEDSWD